MMKWESGNGRHLLVQHEKSLPHGNLVWATVIDYSDTSLATFDMPILDDEKPHKRFFKQDWFCNISSTYAEWKRARALSKAKKWCENKYDEYWKILKG